MLLAVCEVAVHEALDCSSSKFPTECRKQPAADGNAPPMTSRGDDDGGASKKKKEKHSSSSGIASRLLRPLGSRTTSVNSSQRASLSLSLSLTHSLL